jgi:hypothetical protein
LQTAISQLLTRWYPRWNSPWYTLGVMTCWRLEEEQISPETPSHFLGKIVSTKSQAQTNASLNHRMYCTGQHVAKQGFIFKIRTTCRLSLANVAKFKCLFWNDSNKCCNTAQNLPFSGLLSNKIEEMWFTQEDTKCTMNALYLCILKDPSCYKLFSWTR